MRTAALILLLAFATPVFACLNDTEINAAQEQFRSRYNQQEPAPPSHLLFGFEIRGILGTLVAGSLFTLAAVRLRKR